MGIWAAGPIGHRDRRTDEQSRRETLKQASHRFGVVRIRRNADCWTGGEPAEFRGSCGVCADLYEPHRLLDEDNDGNSSSESETARENANNNSREEIRETVLVELPRIAGDRVTGCPLCAGLCFVGLKQELRSAC